MRSVRLASAMLPGVRGISVRPIRVGIVSVVFTGGLVNKATAMVATMGAQKVKEKTKEKERIKAKIRIKTS